MKRSTVLLVAVLVCLTGHASADIANFDFAGKIYTKWLFRNNDSQGVLSYGNPFWSDNITGDNGVATEFELMAFGRVSRYVEAGVRIKSRFGSLWQDWWENGDLKPGEHDTSGESLGMNHAQYMKLRGAYLRFAPPIPGIDWVHVGSSDLSMFNAWTIGKVRYIDRDNGKGSFIEGSVADRMFAYHIGIIALPKLYVGPWWSTGIGDPDLANPFYTNDWAYAAKLELTPDYWGTFRVVGSLTNDLEIDRTDPDAKGTLYPDCTDDLGLPVPGCEEARDHAVGTFTRYANAVVTAEAELEPVDVMSIHLLGGWSHQQLDPQLVANGVKDNQGFFPVIYGDTDAFAGRVRIELFDPFDVGLGFRFEYFNIGEAWNSIFGARREDDVLLTDGFMEGGQLPTLNIANEFMDFDEAFYESCIGWHGGTAIMELATGALELSTEYSLIGYNTNSQNRDVETLYPDFQFTDGFTDPDFFIFPNQPDQDRRRGRDPRSVYHENQDRLTHIAVLGGKYTFDLGRGLDLNMKAKYIRDVDTRSHNTESDDYTGDLVTARLGLSYPFTNELRVSLAGQIDRWFEMNRTGEVSRNAEGVVVDGDYSDADTEKEKLMASLRYDFEGVHLQYYMEYIHKIEDREGAANPLYDVFRSKATVEVAW